MTSENKLAITGGKPVRDSYLPYGRQWLDEEDIQSVVDVLRGDYLTTGPTIDLFEQKVAEYAGSSYAVAFSSGTAALHAACFAAGISQGDEVITTPITFAASANCILYMGAKPVFADIDPLTYNIDPDSIEKLITPKTKAIIPVDFTGQPVNHDRIQKIAKANNLIVIEDAAHALGASYKGEKIGSISDMTMFSFHPVKHITTGEGGMITTNNKTYYEKLLQFRSHGITRDPKKLSQDHGSWYYEMHFLGFNYRMTDIQASLGISQLKKVDDFIETRNHLARIYNEKLKTISHIHLPSQDTASTSSWHLYIINLKLDQLKGNRDDIFNAMQQENIGVNVHYIPVYLHPYYQRLGYQAGLCPNAENFYKGIITLPLFQSMNERDADDVIKALKKVVDFYS
ncbi:MULTISPECIES: UDP-4-amino-4,6-dideoxy-N-acetyl-beta-L-altrosamine transaminase [Bacillus subtilis group]|uniref:UDP-4-amino-4, 6-dideoxy-N-acetyl-beta-L-altrosamine transaminase n=1 Tax=Bacillus subtilis group TaxID=653685 RepID=UPI000C761E1F|nr:MULTISPECIES: UDP-4-amino-4,6-dideoxy-N-acetyl-beta-L-altrosamine transaminase [Bacillus subtilis group]MCO8150551.1 UDP-4-amino-4,6-dideoxy-N-acetyl-beta-L-altrosamine transaminase [Bacillus subtilis]MCY7961894.1 UDP-4-amino-4,6-dideoxy-N-acetyl-beta-L-altrosamine transaminase [Bacillus inaquosorum]MCY8870508.1 UDP-4-amino-4,6-dideoxy-N-acetyl-beta-L-altrosamine transaminase [Bacillus inaquosorum]MCY9069663.1 UDP-4-amino-4,6-dideoxy-N-acetyl-beta-L-altrosamine transaminase [Bacillus inaquos